MPVVLVFERWIEDTGRDSRSIWGMRFGLNEGGEMSVGRVGSDWIKVDNIITVLAKWFYTT